MTVWVCSQFRGIEQAVIDIGFCIIVNPADKAAAIFSLGTDKLTVEQTVINGDGSSFNLPDKAAICSVAVNTTVDSYTASAALDGSCAK